MSDHRKPLPEGLAPAQLRWRCDPARIPFDTTEQAEPTAGPVGQDRALRALKMGVELAAPGYNAFVCGLSGTSRGGNSFWPATVSGSSPCT